ncbi:M43 family zinc metalloprotease [Aureispira anguillae]|uniref:M43 family zinc metalloprotease n=1 Tax=Aureispira anguillae TaxID=2864201 RepID=A0A915YIR7_9BACT|nr:M43 family zinc metalloprotease [Aureispira anguillae]BDS13970.1 M43 family zinc metalloprotease [Aureispira anguillae]
MRYTLLTLISSGILAIIGTLSYINTTIGTSHETCRHSKTSHHIHNNGVFCGFDALQPNISPQEQRLQNQLEQQLYNLIQRGYPSTNGRAMYTIPVVVHVVHNNGSGNIPTTQVNNAIQHLNDAFANVGVYNPATGVDIDIQFCLAQRDPNGNTTNGITNTVSSLTNLNHNTQDLALKNLIRWNPLDYINIWVVNNIQGGVAGYAYFPSSHGNNLDGIVVEANYMGSSPNNSKVLVHEMGHYLGLYHTFQGGCTNNDCLADGDRVCDTPPDNTTSWVPCASVINSCSTDEDDLSANNPYRPIANGGLGDQQDQKENYMDYSDFACYDQFTQGQKIRTHFFLTGIRASLLASQACIAPCTTPIAIGFTASATTVTAGTTVNFTNNTTGATTYNWFINGSSFSTTTNSSFTFNTIGTYNVTLEASNGDPNCTLRDSITISVICNAQASFVANNTQVSPGDVVLFNNTSTGATSYQWFVNNVQQATTTNFNFTFPIVGTYDIFLVASDGVCSDTSSTLIVTVTNTALAQTGLPIWPLAPHGNVTPSIVDWRDTIPVSSTIPTSTTTNGGQTGAAFNECGQLAFYVLHTGSGASNNLFIYAADGSPLLTSTTPNAPGLNGVKAGQEIQVIKVPQSNDEWYIIYKQWTTDFGALGGNGAYTPANWLFSRIQYSGGNTLNIIQRDVPLADGTGNTHTYTDGAAVSRTAAGLFDQHYLYLCRRTPNVNTISLDRFLITNTGITWSANTGNVNAQWWSLTIAGSPIELSPTEDKIAVVCRNQSTNFQDIILFDASLFNSTSAQTISLGNLVLQADGTPNDQSNILNTSNTVNALSVNTTYPLLFLRNMERKVNNVEFSPNGRFLYFTTGGYSRSGSTNLTYLGQIDLNTSPLELRLQIQTVPSGLNMTTGSGCSFASCLNTWNSISGIESCYDGNLYYSKRNLNTLFVIPNPNNFMPQNLVPSNIDLATPNEPNINHPAGYPAGYPDQIDGFNYLASQYKEVELIVQKLDCNGNCDSTTYPLEIVDSSGAVVQSFSISQCPDTLTFCADTSLIYSLQDTQGTNYPYAIYLGQTLYPAGDTLFDFSTNNGCYEICDNGIDDDGDGLVDCYDPDCCGDTSCSNAYYQACLGNACTDSFPSGTFSIQQAWQSSHNVTNWGLSVAGDIDNDGQTEIVGFRSDGAGIAVNGQTGALKYSYNHNNPTQSNGYPAIANLDNDPEAEIVIRQNNDLRVYEHDGTLKWSVTTTIDLGDNTIGIYDFNADGIPEIVYGRRIYSSINGALLVTGNGARGKNTHYSGGLVLAADIIDVNDCAGNPDCNGLELIAGPHVYSVNIVSYTNTALNSISIQKVMAGYGDGYTSVADFDKNGTLDIVVAGFDSTTNQKGVYVWNPKTQALVRPFWAYTTGNRPIGRPNIGDFDGDGALEIAVEAARAGGGRLHVLDNNMSILWSTNNNDASGATGCTSFDFNNDGQKEIIYRDQANLYIINGSNGAIMSSNNCSSGTVVEYPIVADVDNDGQAEIVCHCGGTPSVVNVARITVFESNSTPWMPARSVWNQHAYAYTNINDDLTIPRVQQNHHIVGDSCILNNFLNQHTNTEFVVPDATVSIDTVTCDQDSIIITARICNLGSNVLSYQTPIAIYNANPSTTVGASLVAPIYTIGQNIEKDSCLTLYLKASNSSADFYIVVNDDASTPPIYSFSTDFPVTTIPECNFLNNIDSTTFIAVTPPLDLGPDTTICENSVIELNAGGYFSSYLWQNGQIDSTLTADSSGLYWVEVTNVCGDTFRDSIIITVDTVGLIVLNDSTICLADTLSLTFNNAYSYQWFPNQSISCTNCSTPSFYPTASTTYTVVSNNSIGCFSVDSFRLTVDTCQLLSIIDTAICLGSTFDYQGNSLPPNTIDTFQYTTSGGLDSFVIVAVTGLDTFYNIIDTTICLGDSLAFAGQFLHPTTSTLFHFQTIHGCDSTIRVNVNPLDTFYAVIDTAICVGNTFPYNGQNLPTGSSTLFNFQTIHGCDSTIRVNVNTLDTFYAVIDTAICVGNTFPYNGQNLPTGSSTLFNFQTIHGCDSTIRVNVNPLDTFYVVIDTAICVGNTFPYNGQNLPTGSSTLFNFQTIHGCDSTIRVNVNPLDTFYAVIDTAICVGNTFAYNGQNLPAGSSTLFNFQTIHGCDSTIRVNVNALDTFYAVIDTAICVGNTFPYNGQNLQAGSSTLFHFQTIHGCDSTIRVNVHSFPINFTISNTAVSCNGGNDGTASINVSGGVGGFTYTWNNGQNTATATGLPAGMHCVTATDGNGCTVDTCIQVDQPAGFSNINFSTIDVSCFGGSNGQATISLSGGIQPYSFVWSNGQNGNMATGLTATTHSVTVTDANGCTVTANVVINEPTALQLNFDVDSVQCKNGSDGQIEALVTGGTFPYTYQWDAATGNQNTAIANGLTIGTYSVVVTDFNGCTITASATVSEPQTVLTAAIINQSNPSCHNSCDGMIEVDAQGATPNYTYQWNNGQTSSIATGVCAGVHTVTITDANGCSITAGSVLTEPSAISLIPQVLSNYNGAAISCPGEADGSVGVTAAGGNGGFSYIWSPAGQNTATINGLVEGTYCVTVTDVAGCQADTCISIVDPVPLAATFTQVDVLCHGDANGQIVVNATPGTGTLGVNGYEYKITGPGQSGNVYSPINVYNNLAAGSYVVFVRDGNNCEISLPIAIAEPAPVLIDSVVITDALCFGAADGTAMAHASGGTGTYTYRWSDAQVTNPATGLAKGLYTVTVTDANGCDRVEVFNVGEPTALTGNITANPIPCFGGTTTATASGSGGTPIALTSYVYNWSNGSTSATTIGLTAGVHCVTITDANACSFVTCVTLTQPSTALTASISAQTDATCHGSATGTATAQGTGGTSPYTYQWDAAAANQTSQTAIGLAAGIYTVVVTDSNNCTNSTTVTISEPSLLTAAITTTTNATCNGVGTGTATVAGTGGVPTYTYLWADGQTNATATGLVGGSHPVTLTDANGCTAIATAIITEPTAVDITAIFTTPVACKGGATGSATLSIQGGTPTSGYTFQWSGAPGQNSITATGLSAGVHTVTATDANGCFDVDTFMISEPALGLTGYLTTTDALCFGAASGEIAAVITGGTGSNYTFAWNSSPSQHTVVADSLAAGNYTVTVTDSLGCTLTLTGTVGEPSQLVVTAGVQQDVTCFGGDNGIATVLTTNGGVPTYSYVWTDPSGQVSTTATNLSAGPVTVVATDANMCTASATVTITEATPITVTENVSPVSCHGLTDGSIDILTSNKVLVGYNWSNGFIGNPNNGLAAGVYELTVTDATFCTESFSYTITEPSAINLDIQQTTAILCHGADNATAQVTPTGGSPAYTANWSHGASNSRVTDLAPGLYTVTITDSRGCMADTSITIEEPEALTITGTTAGTFCAGDQTGVLTAIGAGGTVLSGLLEYSIDGTTWQNGNIFSGLSAGIYTLSVKDENGCVVDTALVVEDADPFFISSMTGNTTIEYLDSLTIEATLNDTTGVLYSWTQITGVMGVVTDSSYSFDIAPAEGVQYEFTATNANGCTVDSIVIIDVEKPRRANAATGFTPNGDGVNDYFFIQGGEKVQEVVLFRVYDRWGELVFEGSHLDINIATQGWNGIFRGQPASSGTYSWYADVLFKDGKTTQIKGDVILLR